jgi:hexosaminidase
MSTRYDRPSLRLDSDWTLAGNGGGILTLALTNLSPLPLTNFRLAFTSLFPLVMDGQLRGATVVERISNYQVIAPPEGFVLESGHCWSTSAHLDHTLNHYTSAVKGAYAIIDGDRLLPVETMATTRNRESGTPLLDPWRSSKLPIAAPSPPVVPNPLKAEVAGRRDINGALCLDEGPPQARLAFRAAADLAERLFPSEPPLLTRAGGISCRARRIDLPEENYRIGFA